VLIVGGNQSAGGYEVDNSLRFNDGSSDYLEEHQLVKEIEKNLLLVLGLKEVN
jgi:hypothetical protein